MTYQRTWAAGESGLGLPYGYAGAKRSAGRRRNATAAEVDDGAEE